MPFQASQNPQPDLIDLWQSYLAESMVREGDYSNEELEMRWQDSFEKERYFYGSPQELDEEVIQCWKGCLRKYTSSGGESESEDEDGDSDGDDSGGGDACDSE